MTIHARTMIAVSALALAACAGGKAAAPDAAEEGRAAAEVATAAEAEAQTSTGARYTDGSPQIAPAILARYAPAPSTSKTIDYTLIDEALDLMVFNSGPSLRRRQRRPDALSGTRFVRGHVSPYRLEGNKVFFSQFDDDVIRAIGEYRQSLESIGASGRVQSLPRNEQLAYWYNLHNFVVIDEIAKDYPVKVPRRMKVGPAGEGFHDAKVIALGDDRLSLRDVREIVYTHWSDPVVMYGFYLGDLGGPSVRSEAYTGAGVTDDLDRQAREFVNALRGVSRGGGRLYVSEFYEEGRPHFFPDWPSDIRAHLAEYADEEVAALLAEDREVRYGQYQDRVADMAGGEVFSDLGNRGALGTGSAVPPTMVRMVSEYREKLDELREEGYLKPKVIIIDVPTDDPADAEVE